MPARAKEVYVLPKSSFTMETEFKKQIDSWIKLLDSKVKENDHHIDEIAGGMDLHHDYICDLKHEIHLLREEISALRIVQLMQLKEVLKRKNG